MRLRLASPCGVSDRGFARASWQLAPSATSPARTSFRTMRLTLDFSRIRASQSSVAVIVFRAPISIRAWTADGGRSVPAKVGRMKPNSRTSWRDASRIRAISDSRAANVIRMGGGYSCMEQLYRAFGHVGRTVRRGALCFPGRPFGAIKSARSAIPCEERLSIAGDSEMAPQALGNAENRLESGAAFAVPEPNSAGPQGNEIL